MRYVVIVLSILFIFPSSNTLLFAENNPPGNDKGFLGIMIQDFPEQLKALYPEWYRQGVLVNDVIEGGPGQEAGLRKGDIIIAINGEHVNAAQDVLRVLSKLKRGDKPKILFIRTAWPILTSPPQKDTNKANSGNKKTVPFEPVPFE